MTQKPLAQLIPDILMHIDDYADYSEFNLRLYRVHEGQVKEEVEASFDRELTSIKARQRVKERIPAVNMIRKSADKLSKVYIEAPNRLVNNSADKSILDNIVKMSNLNKVMVDANRMLNVHHMFAIEPYIDDGKHAFRVLGGHQFLPFSDDPVNPNKLTVFIKYLGTEVVPDVQQYNDDGTLNNKDTIRELTLYALYSDSEWMIIDNGGRIRTDKMQEIDPSIPEDSMGEENPFGRIPYIYGNKSSFELIPFPNQQGFDISILVPKLLADLNYSVQFLSHSITWSRNTDLEGKEFAPDVTIDLGDGSDDGQPEIGVIKPEVAIQDTLKLIEFEAQTYFSSVGIKADTSGTMANGRDTSALGKAVDQADTTAERKIQTEFFRNIENELMDLLSDMQTVFSNESEIIEKRRFSANFVKEYRVSFAEMRPVKTFRQSTEEMQLLRNMKMVSRKQVIRELYPDMSKVQVDAWLKEIDDEAQEAAEKQLELGINIVPDRGETGTFSEGNTAAGNQDETSKDETKLDEQV